MATKIKSAMTKSEMTTKVEVNDLTPKDPVKVKGAGVKLTDILVSS